MPVIIVSIIMPQSKTAWQKSLFVSFKKCQPMFQLQIKTDEVSNLWHELT